MKLYSLIFTLTLTCSSVFASTVTIPNSFSSGAATNASQMNANFSAVKAAVDDNHSLITTLQNSNNAAASQFMGFSSGTTTGALGLITMGNLCHASFAGSHVCSTLEFAGAKMNGVSGLSGTAWINPSIIMGTSTASNNDSQVDASNGVTFGRCEASCMGWSTSGSLSSGIFACSSVTAKGRTVSSTGVMGVGVCSTAIAVACCK